MVTRRAQWVSGVFLVGVLTSWAYAAPELPANQWVKVNHASPGGRGWSGVVYCPQAGGALYAGSPNAWNVKAKLYTMALFRWEERRWVDFKPDAEEKLTPPAGQTFEGWNYDWGPMRFGLTPEGRKTPLEDPRWGDQVCLDTHRGRLVAFLRGETLEYDPAQRRWTILQPKRSPQAVYGSSLCYDAVNREVVLANGGFSVEGFPRTTWVYRPAEASWTPLGLDPPGAKLRKTLDELRRRLETLRWLTWKHLEFTATGRTETLDDRAGIAALTSEAERLRGDLALLGEAKAAEAAQAGEALRAVAEALRSGKLQAVEAAYRDKLAPAQAALDAAGEALRPQPGPRMNAKLVYDAANEQIVCFGGDGQDRDWGDTWVYHCRDRRWQKRSPAVHPQPGRAMAAAYDPAARLVVYAIAGPKSPETWAYDAAANEWSLLDAGGLNDKDPPPLWLTYDAEAKCILGIAASPLHPGGELTTYALRLDRPSLKRLAPPDSPEVVLRSIDGPYVLRDAAKVGELKQWQAATDRWLADLPPNTWAEAPAHGTGRPNWGRTWSSLVADPLRRQLTYRDGGHGSYHGSVTDHYDVPTGRWFRSARREEPPWPHGSYFAWGRSFSLAPFCIHTYKYALVLDPLTGRLLRTDVKAPRRYDRTDLGEPMHEYDPDLGRWEEEFSYIPSGGGAFTAPLVPGVPDGLLCVEAFTRYGVRATASVWYSTAAGLKPWADTGPLPRYHDCHEVCYFADSHRRRVLYYGGGEAKATKDRPAAAPSLFELDLTQAQPRWRKLPVRTADGSTLPVPSREIVYLPRHDVFLLLEGMGGTGPKRPPRLWELGARDHVFRKTTIAVAPDSRTQPVHQGVSTGLAHEPASDLTFLITAGNEAPTLWAVRYKP